MPTDTKWKDRMATASFRGFAFLTESHETKFGRRLVVHEFPGAEAPLVEDLGGKSWDGKLSAYFIGADYDKERNGFLERLAEPGADWLTHPWLGYLWVRPHTWSLHESNDKGGYCTVSIEFLPGGEQPFTSTVDKVDVAIDRSRKLSKAAVDDFALEPMSANGMTAFIAAVHSKLEILRTVISLATLPLTWANQIRSLIAGIQGDLAELMALPSAYANALHGLADVFGLESDRPDVADTDRPRLVSRAVSAARSGRSIALTGVAATDPAVRRNVQREEALRCRLLVAAAAQIALADYRAEADRDVVLTTAVAALDALLPGLPDPVFQAVVAARAALIEALLAQDLKPGTVRDVAGPMPATVLAHRMGVDEAVFLARNKVRHPLFVTGRVYG
jgi:prophage DNA circulation protein